MADEEGFHVVVGVDEPAGYAFGSVAADFAGVGVEDVHAVDADSYLSVFGVEDVDVRLAEDDEEVAFAGVFEVARHVQVGVHPGFEDGDSAEFVEFGGVRVVVEGAGDEHVESGVSGFAGGSDKVGTRDGAEFGAMIFDYNFYQRLFFSNFYSFSSTLSLGTIASLLRSTNHLQK